MKSNLWGSRPELQKNEASVLTAGQVLKEIPNSLAVDVAKIIGQVIANGYRLSDIMDVTDNQVTKQYTLRMKDDEEIVVEYAHKVSG